MEKELIAVQTKAENYRQCHSKDSIELKKKIIELENIVNQFFYISKIIIKINTNIIMLGFRSKHKRKWRMILKKI